MRGYRPEATNPVDRSPTRLTNWYAQAMRAHSAQDEAYLALSDSIRRGVYSAARRLPGERALATDLGVSRATLREALSRLEAENTLTRSAQRGWFVPRPLVGEPPSTLQSFTEMARARGLQATAEILDRNVRSATMEEAELLHIAPGAEVLAIRRLRGMDGTPVCVDTNVIGMQSAEALRDEDLTDQSLYDLLERLCGMRIQRSAYSVQAEAATPELAHILKVAAGSPVLVGREIAYLASGRPALLGVNTYRGDAYRFQADLYRPLS
jgi:GntR family transcriptional regulator